MLRERVGCLQRVCLHEIDARPEEEHCRHHGHSRGRAPFQGDEQNGRKKRGKEGHEKRRKRRIKGRGKRRAAHEGG